MMKVVIKKIDKVLNICLWIVFALLVVGAFIFSRSFKAPEFEIVQTSIQIPYEYSSEDGERYDSFYVPVWKHEDYKKPKVAVYDPRNGKSAEIKEEYIQEYKAQMPRSAYPFYTRWTTVICVILTFLAAIFTYYVGGYLRDLILYLKLKTNPSFTECAYFLYKTRVGFEKSVKKLIGKNIGVYIKFKSQELYKKYTDDFASLLVHILDVVRITRDTDVSYYLKFSNNTVDQKKHLLRLRSYWDSQIGKSEHAESNVKYLNSILNREYAAINLLIDEKDVVCAVNEQMNKIFTNILGSEVLKFNGISGMFAKELIKVSKGIFIDINVSNHYKSFTWSGNAIPSNTFIPGLEIEFKMYHYLNGQEKILWRKYLVPVCTYAAKDDEFAITELYKSMVNETIKTFDDNAKI